MATRTTYARAARSFDERVFHWTTDAVDIGPRPVALAFDGKTLNGRFFAVHEGASPYWRPTRRTTRNTTGGIS